MDYDCEVTDSERKARKAILSEGSSQNSAKPQNMRTFEMTPLVVF